jgi:hypothetical protein
LKIKKRFQAPKERHIPLVHQMMSLLRSLEFFLVRFLQICRADGAANGAGRPRRRVAAKRCAAGSPTRAEAKAGAAPKQLYFWMDDMVLMAFNKLSSLQLF